MWWLSKMFGTTVNTVTSEWVLKDSILKAAVSRGFLVL
jgi:hypothetical protein